MANDPRTFTVKTNCPVGGGPPRPDAAKKKSFLDNITGLGDLEFLNDVGLGSVGEGLRTLAAVSDSVRAGKSVVPGREGTETHNSILGQVANTALDAVSEGTKVVTDAIGVTGAIEAVGNINVGAANRAYEAGSQLWDRVKKGKFDVTDIPEVFSDFQNVEMLARGIFPGIGGSQKTKARELCGATPYAMDLIAFAPKFQFMFIIEIKYSSPYDDWNANADQVAFVIKTSTRPRFNVEYEDVNMYGFRTRVTRRVEYQPMEMSFYDDNKNAAHKFYVSYMRAMSPIANWENTAPQSGLYESSGMDYSRPPSAVTFSKTGPGTLGHSASSGPLHEGATSIIQEIRLHHVFDYGNKMSTYHFYNPRITSFTPSDLTMEESGNGADFSFEFAYDGIFIDHMIDLSEYVTKLSELTDQGLLPIDPVYATGGGGFSETAGNGELTSDQAKENAPTTGFLGGFAEGLNAAADGITDAFGNVIGGVTNLAGNVTNGINNVIGDVSAGINSATAGIQSGIDSATKGISGAINQNIGAAQRAIGGLGDTVSNAFKAGDALNQQAKAVNEVFDGGAKLSDAGKKLFGL